MNILLDTHVILWSLYASSNLPGNIRELIEDRANKVYVSSVSVWEVSLKNRKRPDEMPFTAERLINDCEKIGFSFLGLNNKHVLSESRLTHRSDDIGHKDPFDRILIGQAASEDMFFITHDSKLSSYSYDKMMLF